MEMTWGVMALYELVTGRVRASDWLSEIITSTIGVKQGCPLSPTFFGFYIDEVFDFIDRMGRPRATLCDTLVLILLYADDIVPISDSKDGLRKHLGAAHAFSQQRNLPVNLGKTKVMVNTTCANDQKHELH